MRAKASAFLASLASRRSPANTRGRCAPTNAPYPPYPSRLPPPPSPRSPLSVAPSRQGSDNTTIKLVSSSPLLSSLSLSRAHLARRREPHGVTPAARDLYKGVRQQALHQGGRSLVHLVPVAELYWVPGTTNNNPGGDVEISSLASSGVLHVRDTRWSAQGCC